MLYGYCGSVSLKSVEFVTFEHISKLDSSIFVNGLSGIPRLNTCMLVGAWGENESDYIGVGCFI